MSWEVHSALAQSEWAQFTAAHGIQYPSFEDIAAKRAVPGDAKVLLRTELSLLKWNLDCA